MKRLYYMALVSMSLLMGSCAVPGRMILTKDSQAISNVAIEQKKDYVHYQMLDTAAMAGKRKTVYTSDSIYSIHASEVLAGINFKPQRLRQYYIELPALPKDTVVDIAGSRLAARRYTHGLEYVLRTDDNEHYMIPRKQLMTFYKNNSPEAYALQKKGNNLIYGGIAMLAGGYAMGISAEVFGLKYLLELMELRHNPWFTHDEENQMKEEQLSRKSNTSLIFMGIAACMVYGSIPLFTVGVRTRNKALDVYNAHASQSPPTISLNTQISNNGVGLVLQF